MALNQKCKELKSNISEYRALINEASSLNKLLAKNTATARLSTSASNVRDLRSKVDESSREYKNTKSYLREYQKEKMVIDSSFERASINNKEIYSAAAEERYYRKALSEIDKKINSLREQSADRWESMKKQGEYHRSKSNISDISPTEKWEQQKQKPSEGAEQEEEMIRQNLQMLDENKNDQGLSVSAPTVERRWTDMKAQQEATLSKEKTLHSGLNVEKELEQPEELRDEQATDQVDQVEPDQPAQLSEAEQRWAEMKERQEAAKAKEQEQEAEGGMEQ